MGFSIDLLNTIRANASAEFQERIPPITQANISAMGEALTEYTLLRNEYQEALVNKIGKTMIESKLFKNKLARFKKGKATPNDVEEIFIEMASTIRVQAGMGSENFNRLSYIDTVARTRGTKNNTDPTKTLYDVSVGTGNGYATEGGRALSNFGQPEVKAIYHRLNRQDVYPVTIGDLDFQRVFRSEATHDNFVTGLINSLYSGAAYDEWLIMKELIGSYSGYVDYTVPKFDASAEAPYNNMERFLATLKKASLDISFASIAYNKMGVRQWTEPKNQVLLLHKDVVAETDVTTLAKAFQLNKMDIPVDNIIVLDDFGSGTEVTIDDTEYITEGILIDEDIFRIWDTLFHFEPQRNALTLHTNYFLHVQQILSMSTFKNAVRFLAPKTATT